MHIGFTASSLDRCFFPSPKVTLRLTDTPKKAELNLPLQKTIPERTCPGKLMHVLLLSLLLLPEPRQMWLLLRLHVSP